MSSISDVLVFYVNGRKIQVSNIDPEESLLYYLRRKLRLTGTKYGCGEGSCGACTVMVSQFNREKRRIENFAVNACLMSVCSVHGKAVTTVEGIGSTKTFPHPIQERIAKCHGTQCGFCSPGMVMSMYALLRNNPQPSIEEIEYALQGNLCRCTGYRPILNGVKTFTSEFCCGNKDKCCQELKDIDDEFSTELYQDFATYDPTQEPIFPSELQLSDVYDTQTNVFIGPRVKWIRTVTLKELLKLKEEHKRVPLIFGNTSSKILKDNFNQPHSVVLAPSGIPELTIVQQTTKELIIGAANTISDLQHVLWKTMTSASEFQARNFKMIIDHLNRFGCQQIRNVVALGSNIIMGFSNSDLNVLLMAVDATIDLISKDKTRRVKISEVMNKNETIHEQEIILSIRIPIFNQHEYFFSYKQSMRRFNDNAVINAAFKFELDAASDEIKSIIGCFGGIATSTMLARNTMNYLIGKFWSHLDIDEAVRVLEKDILEFGDLPNLTDYKRTLASGLLFKLYTTMLKILSKERPHLLEIPQAGENISATRNVQRNPYKNLYSFPRIPQGQLSQDLIGRPIMHHSGIVHTTGEAIYCDDIPMVGGQLYMGLVKSKRSHAKILSIDFSPALAISTVVGYMDHRDAPGDKLIGYGNDEEVFASSEVVYQNQLIGIILAEDELLARRAAEMVIVEYKDLPSILSIEEAAFHESYLAPPLTIEHGNAEEALKESDHVLEGEMYIGAQKHLYIEPVSVAVIPRDGHNEMEIFVTSQDPTALQLAIVKILNIPSNRIAVKVKRVGGAYGGKFTPPFIIGVPAALAAAKFNRPVRYTMTREEDMTMIGTRHPYLYKYKVGVTKEGRLLGIMFSAYSNGGYSIDCTIFVMDVNLSITCCYYYWPNIKINAYYLKTNLPSNTAFRGFGAPQGIIFIENVMNRIAKSLNLSQNQVREINFPTSEMRVFKGLKIPDSTILRCWKECLEKSDYVKRKAEIDTFNSCNKWKKRGISMAPTFFGCGISGFPLNWGAGLVHINQDGNVLITHGGIEMGQGQHTKLLQVASRVLHIPISKIHISETATDKIVNIHPDGGGVNADLNGRAIKVACQTLLERLEPYINTNLKGTWEEWVKAAFADSVNLSALGFEKISNEFRKNNEMLFDFGIFGAGCCEVEIDCLTGEHQILRFDTVVDMGESLNPAIDIGQIEGGFLQGQGMVTMEEWKVNKHGEVLSKGPKTYKIPTINEIPCEFNVHFLSGVQNKNGLYSSKGPGEYGFSYVGGILMSIKNAIYAAREDEDIYDDFRLDSPATAEKIRLACLNKFNKAV